MKLSEKLFSLSKFSDIVTKDKKREAWKDIGNLLHAQGLLQGRSAEYLRDTTWTNLKRATIVS